MKEMITSTIIGLIAAALIAVDLRTERECDRAGGVYIYRADTCLKLRPSQAQGKLYGSPR